MKVTITIENGRVEVAVDDQQAAVVQSTILEKPVTAIVHNPSTTPTKPFEIPSHFKKSAVPSAPVPNTATKGYDPKCGYCKRRGEACLRHGGVSSQKINAKRATSDTFEDPWNCEMCRNAQDLCTMHQKMTDDGQEPPRYKHSF